MRLRRLLMVAVLLLWQGAADASCDIQERTNVAFTATAGHLLMPLAVNGIAANFVLDTGAERSMVTPQAVRRLNLALDQWVGTTMRGVGGVVEHPNANPRSLTLGGVALQRRTVNHDTSLTVGALRDIAADVPIDGLLGRDFLSLFDLQLDMVARRLTLYQVQGCGGRFLPWTQPYAAVPASGPLTRAPILPITLDGHSLHALLDTGASGTMITLSGQIRLGLNEAALAGDRGAALSGVGRQRPEGHRHRFASLQVGNETVRDPVLWVAPVRVVPFVDALLGADWLAVQSRVWISFTTGQVFFAAK